MAPSLPSAASISASTRYYSNLTVLRRHDPSIDTILDVFPHVCVYAHDGVRWEKAGYEGVLLLFERKPGHYPPYGFYIMNRMSVGDYIQFIYPEDSFSQMGKYLYIYHFPEFTEKRMRYVKETYGKDCGMEAYVPTPEWLAVPGGKKGTASSIGLWIENKDDGPELSSAREREPMYSVLIRVHDLTKKGERYPDEYRYGPDKPAPNMTGKPLLAPQHISDASDDSTDDQIDNPELDQLLAKLGPYQNISNKVKTTATTTQITAKNAFKSQDTKQTHFAVQSLFQQPTRDVLPTAKSGSDLLAALFDTSSMVAASLMAPSTETIRPHSYVSSPSNEDSSVESDAEPRRLTTDVISSLLANMHSSAHASHPTTTIVPPISPTSSNDAGSSSQQHTESDDDSLTYQSSSFHAAPSQAQNRVPDKVSARSAVISPSLHTTPTPSQTLSFFAPPAGAEDIDDEDTIPEIDFKDTHLLEGPDIKRKVKLQSVRSLPVRPPLNSTPSLLDQLFMADTQALTYPESNATPSPESSPESAPAKVATSSSALPMNGNGHVATSLMDQLRSSPAPLQAALPSFAPPKKAISSHDTNITAQALLDTFLSSKPSHTTQNGHVNGAVPRAHKYGTSMPRARTKNDLIKGLLEKIHNDEAFGDHLWEAYERAVIGL